MRLTKIFLILPFYIFYFIFNFTLSADTIVDSVYATPVLDGYVAFSQNNQSLFVNNWMYSMSAGDLGISMIEPDPNSRMRSYISFELPQIPDGYELDSVYVKLYQYICEGNSVFGEYPIWNVPGGDTMFCIMDHIDYGDELDVSDWTKGDPGDSGTLHTNIGIISDSGEDGYRYLGITDYVQYDYENGRDKTQYRIRFPIETDWDYLYDNLGFKTTTSTQIHQHPIIFLFFKLNNYIDNNFANEVSNKIFVYPNPFIGSTTIKFNSDFYIKPRSTKSQIKIYNIKGKLVKFISAAQINWKGGENKVIWDGRDENDNVLSNGLYLIKVEGKDVNVIKKVLKLN